MVKCNICNGETTEIEVKEQMLGTNEKFVYNQCVNCGHTHLSSLAPDLKKYYNKDEYYSFQHSPFSSTSTFSKLKTGLRKVSFLSSPFKAVLSLPGISKSSTILDYGCGAGDFVKELIDLGYNNTKGYDPYLSEDTRQNGILYLTNDLTRFQNSKWDLITLNHVLEHLENPVSVLKSLSLLLSDKGKLILRFPVIDSYAFEKYKENWVQFDAPRHINLFTRKSIRLVIEQAGNFKLLKLYDDSYHFQFTGSELYLKKLSLNPKNNNRLKRLLSVKTYYYHFLAKKLNHQNKGDQVVVILEKNTS